MSETSDLQNAGSITDPVTFLYTALHEIKTPLREIELYSQFVREDNEEHLPESSVNDLRAIERTCTRVMDMIKKMTDYYKAGDGTFEQRRVNINRLVKECFDDIVRAYPERSVKLRIGNLPPLTGDYFSLRVMIMNILSNCVKYTDKQKHAVIAVDAGLVQDEMVYSFRDNGIGFDAKYAPHLFELFYRVHGDDEYEGSGIGLAAVQKIAVTHGGKALIEGEPGKGCTVYIHMPVSRIRPLYTSRKNTPQSIRIGVISDFSKIGNEYERSKRKAYELAVNEINASGGILGKKVELLFRDDGSDIDMSRRNTEELILEQHVNVLMGSTYATNREAIRAVADRHRTLFIENQQTEGGVTNHYTFCVSAGPEHQILPLMRYMMRKFGKRCYIISSDHHFSILTAEWVKLIARKFGGDAVGVQFVKDPYNTDFDAMIGKILDTEPDFIYSLLIIPPEEKFYEHWHDEGLSHIPIASHIAVAETGTHLRIKPPALEGLYTSASFLESLKTASSRDFVKKFRESYDISEVPYMTAETESVYTGIYLYKLAVELAGTEETEAVIHALESGDIMVDGAGGEVIVRGEDHQTIRDIVVFKVDKNHTVHPMFKTKHVYSDYIETMIEKTLGVKGGLKTLGINSPNIQYNLLLNKYDL